MFNGVAAFEGTHFNGITTFNSSRFKEDALFEDADFNCTLYLMRTKYDKLYIRWCDIKDLAYDDAAYLSLLENFKKLGYLEDYDNCYYEYRKEHRSQDWRGGYHGMSFIEEWVRKKVDIVLEWSYGYGKRPLNPILGSLFAIAIFGLFWRWVGLGTREWPPVTRLNREDHWSLWLHSLIFSFTVFLSGTKLFIDPPDIPLLQGQSELLVKRAFIAERALGAFFSILFFLAIGATIVR